MNPPSEWRLPGATNRGARSLLFLLAHLLAFTLSAQTPLRLGDLDADNVPTVIDLQRLINHLNAQGGAGSLPAVLTPYADLNDDGRIDQTDLELLRDAILGITSLPALPTLRILEASPAHGEEMVSPERTVIIRFNRRVDPGTVGSNTVYLIANNERLPARLELSSTETFLTLFPAQPFPASTEVRIVVDGANLRSREGWRFSGSADSLSASAADEPSALQGQFDFRTLPLFRIPGTHIWGYVFDSYNTNADGSLSLRSPRDTNAVPLSAATLAHPMGEGLGVRAAAIPSPGGEGQGEGGPVFPLTRQRPVIGATIRVDAFPQGNAITDARGYFILTNMPAPEFFVHVDGTTATNAAPGTVYPSVGKPFHSIPGQSVQLLMGTNPFHVYLPPMAMADVAPLDTNELTDVFFGTNSLAQLAQMFPTNDPAMFRKVCVRYPPGSARDNAGRLATSGIIIPVPPDRIPAPLPPNLNPRLVISVQAMLPDGAAATRFDVPAPVIFPNLDGLAPGEKALFFSFNHAAGRWDVIGAGTATTNGTIETDPGVGIRAPGWHLVQVGTSTAGKPCATGEPCARFVGRHGDVIVIDLRGTVAQSDRPDLANFVIQRPIQGGELFEDPAQPLSSSGIAYFVPHVATSSTGEDASQRAIPTPGTPSAYTTTFQTTLVRNGSSEIIQSDPNSGCQPDGPGRSRCIGTLRIEVYPDYSTSGNPSADQYDKVNTDLTVKPVGSFLSILRLQQRLRYLGFPGWNNASVTVDGSFPQGSDSVLAQAVRLFQAATCAGGGGSPGTGTSIDAPRPAGCVDGIVGPNTANWLNAKNAPRWLELPLSFQNLAVIQTERYGTSWAIEIIWAAVRDRPQLLRQFGFNLQYRFGCNSLTAYPSPPVHRDRPNPNPPPALLLSEHRGGLDIDWELDEANVPNNLPFNEPLPPGTTVDDLIAQLTEEERDVVDDIYAFYRAAGPLYQKVLVGGSGMTEPSYPRIRQILRLKGVPSVSALSGHHNHFHFSLVPPAPIAAAPFAPSPLFQPASPTPISTAPGFGSDTRLYYRFELANGFELAGRSSMAGTFTEILSPNVDYTLTLYRPADNRWAVYRGRSNASGQVTDLGTLILDQFGGPDTDGDGIPDAGEFALGTRPDSRDSDGDGLSDDAELTQGLNPNDGRSFPTGIIASLPLRGEAKEVVVEENLAYVATGSYGLAVVDVSRFDNPIILGQLDLPGDATDVAVVPALNLAVVASGAGGLHLVDVSDPMTPRLARTLPLIGTRLEVFATVAYVTTGISLTAVDLLTGQTLQTLSLGGTFTDVALEGSYLYTMSSTLRLQAVELRNFAMTNRGSLILAEGGGQLFVGNGIAYVAAASTAATGGGFSTVNVANPTNLVLISDPDRTDGRPSAAIVANGSGLGVLVGTIFPTSPATRQPRFYVMNLGDPFNTDNVLTYYVLSPGPQNVALASGIGFVANGTNGLTVVNYRRFDDARVPPTISLAASFSLSPPQAEEGKAARLSAITTDDVQVRDVEFYINGELAGRDLSFPFEHRFVAPVRTPGTNSFRVRAKATDTGGNIAWSQEYEVTLFADLTPPEVVRVSPAAGLVVSNASQVTAYFNEPLNSATLNGGTFRLTTPGPDGRSGTADDVLVTNGVLTYYEQSFAVALRFATNLPYGVYTATLTPPLGDPAGNVIANYLWQFLVTSNAVGCTGVPIPCPDTDGDGLSDAAEVLLGTNPNRSDTDRDGASDYDEIFRYGTNPRDPDMDGDGWPDGFETTAGADPRNSASRPAQRFSIAAALVTVFNVPPPEPLPSSRMVVSPVAAYWNQPELMRMTNQFLATPVVSYENQ